MRGKCVGSHLTIKRAKTVCLMVFLVCLGWTGGSHPPRGYWQSHYAAPPSAGPMPRNAPVDCIPIVLAFTTETKDDYY